VNDAWSGFIELHLRDDHLRERLQGCKDRSSNPHGELVLFWGDDHFMTESKRAVSHFMLGNTLVDGGTTGNYDGSIEILTEADITFHA
jgi:hypothetical protein